MKKVIALLLAAMMLFSLAACGNSTPPADTGAPASGTPTDTGTPADTSTPAASAEPIEIDLGHGNAVGTPVDNYTINFATLVNEYSEGRITINLFPAGQLGSLQEMQDAVEMGSLDMTVGDSSLLSNIVPQFAIINLPMLITSYEQAAAVYDGESVAELVEVMAADHNLRQLAWCWNGFRHLITKTPIYSLSDCKGIKLRSPEADVYVDTFSILGFNPTPIAWGDTYSGISSGVADGSDTTLEGMYNSDFYSLCKYICLSGHMFSVVGLTINEDLWQSLSVEDQEIIQRAATDATLTAREQAIADEQVFYDLMSDAGVTYTEFENKQEVVDAFMSYWSETAESCDGGMDLLNEIIALG